MERLVNHNSMSKPHHRSSSLDPLSKCKAHATNLSSTTRPSRMHLTVHPFHYLPIRPSSMNYEFTNSKTERSRLAPSVCFGDERRADHLIILVTQSPLNIITFDYHWPWRTCVHRSRWLRCAEDDCDRDLTTPSGGRWRSLRIVKE